MSKLNSAIANGYQASDKRVEPSTSISLVHEASRCVNDQTLEEKKGISKISF